MTPFKHFTYQNNRLFCENCDVELIAQKQGTPLYIYSYQSLVDQFAELDTAFAGTDHLICYSVKANSNMAIMKIFFSLGSGADVVSVGEMRRALNAGCDPKKIVFSGVGKTSEEIHFALQQGILQINVESEQELLNIQRIAQFLDIKAPVAIRVNPDVDPKTHPYIATGLKQSKFGVSEKTALELYKKSLALSHVNPVGIDCHIGSQITEMDSFTDAAQKLANMVRQLKEAGHEIKNIDVGGGLGIHYRNEPNPRPADYAKAILSPLKDMGCRIVLEPGRFLVGNAGALLTKVIYLKKGEEGQHFTIVDAAFNDLMRPALYGAYHEFLPAVIQTKRSKVKTTIVGPVCETTDVLAHDREIVLAGPGEYLAIMSAGAYGMTMASTFNSRPRPAEILVKDKMFYVIKKPDRLEDITQRESLPEFLKDAG